jgi:hypothetical protein
MDYTRLQLEVTTDPVTLGYAGKTDQQAADLLNSLTTGRTVPRTQVPVAEVFNAIDNGAWPAASATQDKLAAVLNMQIIDASNANTRGIIGSIFPNSGATAATNQRLQALSTRTVSRADELALGGVVAAIDVNRARSGVW